MPVKTIFLKYDSSEFDELEKAKNAANQNWEDFVYEKALNKKRKNT